MTGRCSSRTGTLSKSRPSTSGDTSSTTGQSWSGGSRGAGRGAGGPPHTRPYTLSARWKSFQGNLLRYQQQLEGAREMHSLSRELDDITERIGEKVSSEGAMAAHGPGE